MDSLLLLVIVLFAPILIGVGLYNSLIDKRNRLDEALSSVDVMLKKRYDLVPNLVAAVERYMDHERDLLRVVTELRTRAMAGHLETAEGAELDRQMEAALGRLMVAVEAYPELKASQNFLQLQAALNEIEEKVGAARRNYNRSVTDYNNAIETFPRSMMAASMRLQRKPVFEVAEAERQAPDVKALFRA